MHVIMHKETGLFLTFPEGKHYGAPQDLKPFGPEWVELDHATRFLTAEIAAGVLVSMAKTLIPVARLLTLEEAWSLT